SWVHTSMTLSGIPIEDTFVGFEAPLRIGVTGAVDYLGQLAARVSLVVSARYSLIDRSEAAHDLGAGINWFRIGAGLRFRLK
ncbi:MAG TPA: hypothetical protein VEA16_00855, partial [Vicinamibacterales bacterium]|nr:hypothetical protein [Vicinamibacterales bacterium]